ncbi:Receptor-like protein kinase [Linum perenne]
MPSSLGSLSCLEELYLDNNLLSGPIPVSFGSLTTVKLLEIQGNNLSDEFPDLHSLRNLYYLDANNNKFSHEFDRSTFPPSLIELSIRNKIL